MLKFIGNVLVFAILLGTIGLFGANFLINDPRCASNEYMQSAYDKHKHLSEKEPKVVIMGGSSIAFGIDSEQIADYYRLDVVNMGLHAGLDLHFMLNSIRDEVGHGDVILLLFEYNVYTSPSLYSEDTVFRYVKYYPRMLKYVDIKYFGSMILDGLPAALRLGMGNFINYKKTGEVVYNGVYDRSGFNKYGDMTAHWDLPGGDAKNFGSLLFGGETVDSEKLGFLDEFCRYVKEEKGVHEVIISFPPVPEGQINVKKVEEIITALEKYDSFEIAGDYRDYIFGTDMFYDTYYHLDGEGADIRTVRLVKDLKNS